MLKTPLVFFVCIFCLFFLRAFAETKDLQNSNTTIYGIYPGGAFGTSLTLAGDLNGDGIDDFIVGSPFAGNIDHGEVFAFFGQQTTGPTIQPDFLNGTNGFSIKGHLENLQLGFAVESNADFNNDGIPDIALGMCTASTQGKNTNGLVNLFLGRSTYSSSYFTQETANTQQITIHGPNSLDFLGCNLALQGDFNGDGIPDLVLSSHGAQGSLSSNEEAAPGIVYVLHGTASPSGSYSLSNFQNSQFGSMIEGAHIDDCIGMGSIAYVGDVNQDGRDDIVVGSHISPAPYENQGVSYIIFGHDKTAISISVNDFDGYNGAAFYGPGIASYFGFAASPIGDFDNDGYPDFAISARDYSYTQPESGLVYIIYGAPMYWPTNEMASFDERDMAPVHSDIFEQHIGYTLRPAGDINNDGFSDFFIGAAHSSPHEHYVNMFGGRAYVVFGQSEPNKRIAHINLDLLNEAPSGQKGFIIENSAISPYNMTGFDACFGDFNNDGIDDFVISSPSFPSIMKHNHTLTGQIDIFLS